jgi:RNA polymerase sigma-70 factor (ECF subfamily)
MGVSWYVKAGNDSSQFRASMEQVRSGSTDAVWRLIEDYGPHIQRVVRRRLDSRMRSKFDSQDFVQMVWASFFRNPAEMSSFDEPEDLMRYLSAMARHKVVNEYRRRILQQKHNVTREKPLSETHSTEDVVRRRDPTPSQFAIIREDWNRKLEGMSDMHRKVVRLRLAGATYTEIGQQVGIHERTAREIVHRVFDD